MKNILFGCVVLFSVTMTAASAAENAASAAKKAAEYLLKQQNENGTFGKAPSAGMPGMAGLVLKGLAGSPGKLREDNPAIARAVKFLLSKQQPNGSIRREAVEGLKESTARIWSARKT